MMLTRYVHISVYLSERLDVEKGIKAAFIASRAEEVRHQHSEASNLRISYSLLFPCNARLVKVDDVLAIASSDNGSATMLKDI